MEYTVPSMSFEIISYSLMLNNSFKHNEEFLMQMQTKKLIHRISAITIGMEAASLMWSMLHTIAANPHDALVVSTLLILGIALMVFIGLTVLCFDADSWPLCIVFTMIMVFSAIKFGAITLSAALWLIVPITALCTVGIWWYHR